MPKVLLMESTVMHFKEATPKKVSVWNDNIQDMKNITKNAYFCNAL